MDLKYFGKRHRMFTKERALGEVLSELVIQLEFIYPPVLRKEPLEILGQL